jgi:hypothetical protein
MEVRMAALEGKLTRLLTKVEASVPVAVLPEARPPRGKLTQAPPAVGPSGFDLNVIQDAEKAGVSRE